jgi:Zn-dependent M16 (insulinase) family peptidase
MSFELGKNYSGFQLQQQESISELNSLALLFTHLKTGAEVLVMENDDDNKVFSATFKTPPSNDRGVAHILEHSVLCGSRKYPVKEPFLELLKGSLQTFLNAMTFPDKTMYPVASRNKKDFFNLMDVYLDAVFYPNITQETFMQEGWHHELELPDENISYKGVVFNEMKGVFSSPESILDRHLAHSLFPSTTYGFESGGDPEAITDLTYKEFKDFHNKHYHPSNSRIFFYGDGNTLEYLNFLDNEYLKNFDSIKIESAISPQRRFSKPKRKEIFYPVAKDESLDKKTFVVVGFKLDKSTNHEHCLAFSILSHLLLGTSASPLRKALLESELGSEVIGGGFDDNRFETTFAVGLKGTEASNEDKIIGLIFSTLKNLVDDGIETNMVKSAVNSIDFKLRESNFGGFPKGIVYNIQTLASWLYGSDPFMHLKYDKLMEKIKRKSNEKYFENLIDKYLLNNNHQSVMLAKPKPDLEKKKEARIRKNMKTLKASMSQSDIENLVQKTQELQAMQIKPDSQEALEKLPSLDIQDITVESERFPMELKRESEPKILFHDLFTNNIAYVQIGFDALSIPLDQIPYLSLVGNLVLGMGTRKHSYMEISQLLGIHTGGLRSWHFTSAEVNDHKKILSHIFFSGKCLMGNTDHLFDIWEEVILEYDFNNPKRLIEIIKSSKASMEDSILSSGNHYVLSRLNSYQSIIGQYDELTDGISYYRFLERLLDRAEKNIDEVTEEFKGITQNLFTKENIFVNITAPESDYKKIENRVVGLSQKLPSKKQFPAKLKFKTGPINEAFLTASSVQFVGKGINLFELGMKYSGRFDVLNAVLRTCFLWDRVRVQGGAYGSQISFDSYSGDYGFVSYRDPNLTETLDIYDQIGDYLDTLDISDKELTKILIGCVGRLDPPMTADRKGSISMVEYLTGKTYELKQKRRDELLSTRLDDIKSFAGIFRKIKESGNVCVLGNEEKIKKSKNRFDHLVKVFD